LAFVTADTTTGTSGSESYYNNFVTAEAAPLTAILPRGTTWSAITSTPSTPAITNAPTYSGIRIYNTLGQFVAYGGAGAGGIWNQFDSPVIAAPINGTQSGGTYEGFVWTGTNADGSIGDPLGSHEAGPFQFSNAGYAGSIYLNGGWIFPGALLDQSSTFPLYALSSPIAVPVPEPATLSLLGPALLGLGVVCLRRRRLKA
jgi:hypothetical protein